MGMGDTLTCPGCGEEIHSTDEVEVQEDVPEVEVNEDRSFNLYGNRDLFLCKNCKKPLGMRHDRS